MHIKVNKISPEFTDSRGYISRIVDQNKIKIRSVLYIVSKKGTERANHYHKKDYHYVFCISGKIKYSEKNMKKPKSEWQSVMLEPGDIVLTHPMIVHKMEFMKLSVFLAITTEKRNTKAYERDTVRI